MIPYVSAQGPPSTEITQINKSSWKRLDDRAAAARPGDDKSIHQLAHGIFEPFGWANRKEIATHVEGRLARAELAYRAGQHPAIAEDNVVNAVNNLADKLGAPDYSKTDRDQIQQLRFELSFSVPQLVAPPSADTSKVIASSMSPVEATYVALSMVHQKLFNGKYQVSTDEWRRDREAEKAQRRAGSSLDHRKGPSTSAQLVASSTGTRTQETLGAIATNTPFLSTDDISTISDSALDDLGVSK